MILQARQNPGIVGFQGERGAFSDAVARRIAPNAQTRGFASFEALIAAVAAGTIQLAILPCENSLHGSIARAYDVLLDFDGITIVGETHERIVQALIGLPGVTIDEITTVRSHPVALEQCRDFFARDSHLEAQATHDTAGAVREIIELGDRRIAAIGPIGAATIYGAEVLKASVNDDMENVTRFFVVAKTTQPARVATSFCLALHLPHRPGALHEALGALAAQQVNLRSLVARPSRIEPFEYTFYLECQTNEPLDVEFLIRAFPGRARVLGAYDGPTDTILPTRQDSDS
ncbi:MAG: prephenate dehydratase [Vulcanimicrobiaceae bacterium]